MSLIDVEQVVLELEHYGVSCNKPHLKDKLVELCHKYGKSDEEIGDVCLAFMQSYRTDEGMVMTSEILEKLDLQMGKKSKSVKPKLAEVQHMELDDIYETAGQQSVIECYDSPQTVGRSKMPTGDHYKTPKSAVQDSLKKRLNTRVSLSPSSAATPSQKYAERTNPLDVLLSFGSADKTIVDEDQSELKVATLSKLPLTTDVRFMHQKLWEIANVLSEHIDSVAENIREAYKEQIESFENVMTTSSETFHICGLICCDSVGKLNPQSVLLQGSQSTSLGCSIPLDLSGLAEFCLFPGQIVAFGGSNPTGRQFVATKCYSPVAPDATPIKLDSSRSSMTIVVAAGPFTTGDSLSYEPLTDLITYVIENQPDCLIMMGPFVDRKHPQIEAAAIGMTFQQYFNALLTNINTAMKSCKTKVLVIPSMRDAVQTGVYPTAPYILPPNKQITTPPQMLADPSLLEVGGIVIGATSVDSVMHLSAESIFQSSTDRIQTLTSQLLTQQCFYPLNPPMEDVSIDYRLFQQHAELTIRPHLLIVPSNLRFFIKNVDGVICINPGTLAKGLVGGSFARISVDFTKLNGGETTLESCVKAEVIKI